jgi:hypothetical protein
MREKKEKLLGKTLQRNVVSIKVGIHGMVNVRETVFDTVISTNKQKTQNRNEQTNESQ